MKFMTFIVIERRMQKWREIIDNRNELGILSCPIYHTYYISLLRLSFHNQWLFHLQKSFRDKITGIKRAEINQN